MPIIDLATLEDRMGGAVGVTTEVTAVAKRGSGLRPRVTGEQIVFPELLSVTIIDGIPNDQLVLTELPQGYFWKITVYHNNDAPYRINAVLPAGDGPFTISELISVDPVTGTY